MNKRTLRSIYHKAILATWPIVMSAIFPSSLFFFLLSGTAADVKFIDLIGPDAGTATIVLCYIPVFAIAAAVCFLIWSVPVLIAAWLFSSIKKSITLKDAFCLMYKWSVWLTFPLLPITVLVLLMSPSTPM